MLYYHLFHTQENSLERFAGPASSAQNFNMYLIPGRKKKTLIVFLWLAILGQILFKNIQANIEQMRKSAYWSSVFLVID